MDSETGADPTILDQVWEEYAASLNAGDMERWLALWTEDGIQMPPGEAPVVGKLRIRERNQDVADQFTFDMQVFNEEGESAGDWAYCRGTYRATLTPRTGGDVMFVDGKFMSILARQADGSWKIHRDIFNSNVPPGEKQ